MATRTTGLAAAAANPPAHPLAATALVRDYAPGEGVAAGAADRAAPAGDGWIEVPVPGDVHRALVDAGRIEHPFYDRQEDACRWMEEREWWYRIEVDGVPAAAPGERLQLVMHGVDTFATVYLNGDELGRHANMFRPATFDVTARLQPGAVNLVAVRFDPPLAHAGPPLGDGWEPFNAERVWMRKAQYGYGWDWGPRLPTVGIWRHAELRRERGAALAGVRFTTLGLRDGEAIVELAADVERLAGAGDLEVAVELAPPPGGTPFTAQARVERGRARVLGQVREPVLWWTHDLGEPALYELRVRLLSDGEEVDIHVERVGLRTVELDQTPDPAEPGSRFFRFRLNGVPLFARGANWIPADSFVGAAGAERYERLVRDARDANMNMLRVWGGGIYEHDLFYELCDRAGVLVWQDFMFACAPYPEDELAEEVALEARYQVARLRNHPSLALWCGNNENQWIHDLRHPERLDNRVPGARFYDDVLPRAVAELSPGIPYWPGSPYGGDDHNGRADGDVHNWEVWHGGYPRRFGEPQRREPTPESVSFTRYAEDHGRFISEFGTLSAPDRETLRRWIPADQLYHHSAALDHHTKDTPKNKVDMLLESVTGVPDELDDFIDFSMIAQAEAMKFGIEHFRRRSPHCSGTLVWQLNDCWPGLSWALIDYHGFGKAAYFAVRRAFAPVLASLKVEADGAVELWVSNDTARALRDTATVRLAAFAGDVAHEEQVAIALGPHETGRVRRWAPGALAGGADRYLVVRSAAAAFAPNRTFFAPIKDLARPRPIVESAVDAVNGGDVQVHLRTDAYAHFVHVAVPDERVRYSDNYLELEPGEARTVTLSVADGAVDPEDVDVRWR